jgi:hypothetical protein
MFATTHFLMDTMKSSWAQDVKKESIDNEVEHIYTAVCTSICIISILPFVMMYDIGYNIGSECTRPDPVMQVAPRRSARLAEKYARLKQM